MKENEMKEIADIFATTIKNYQNSSILQSQTKRVLELCKAFPIYT